MLGPKKCSGSDVGQVPRIEEALLLPLFLFWRPEHHIRRLELASLKMKDHEERNLASLQLFLLS